MAITNLEETIIHSCTGGIFAVAAPGAAYVTTPFSGHTFSYTHNDGDRATLTWFWKTEHYTTVSHFGNGHVTAAGASVLNPDDTSGEWGDSIADTLTLTAVPDSGWSFKRWEGDIGTNAAASATIVLDHAIPRAVHAVFACIIPTSSLHGSFSPTNGVTVTNYGAITAYSFPYTNEAYTLTVDDDTLCDILLIAGGGGGGATIGGGGGVFIPGDPGRAGSLRECRLFGNKYAGYWGGQLHACGGLVDRCVIEGDASMVNAGQAGGVMLSGNATIRSSLITGNRATSNGAGVRVYYPALVHIVNCTITGNFITGTASSTASGPGLYIAQSPENHPGRVEVVNTIIHGNHLSPATPEPAEFTLAANPDFFESQNSKAYVTIPFLNNLTSFDTTGYEADKLFSTNSLAADPLFKLSGSTPFKPALNSPCVDNGVVEEWMYGAKDLIGQRRVAGASVDIGAYEKGLSTMLILR